MFRQNVRTELPNYTASDSRLYSCRYNHTKLKF